MSKSIFTVLLSCLLLSTGCAQTKHALLVGVGQYPSNSGWDQLHAENDVALLYTTLKQQNFSKSHITRLLNEAANKKGIVRAIEQQLIAKVKKGDIALLALSGHGQQTTDESGDEIDGLDEAFVPIDSPKDYVQGEYEGANLLRDDELGVLLQQLRRKLGKDGQLIVLIDACHSGTSTRGYGTSRGTSTIMASPDYIKRLTKTRKDANSAEQIKEKGLASLINIYSSSAQQLSYEHSFDGKQYGVLSYAFCAALKKATKTTSYRDLFKRIRQTVQLSGKFQNPEIEGNTDLVVFKNQLVETAPYTKVTIIDFDGIKLDAGTLQGFQKGAKIGFYKGAKTNANKPFVRGEVTNTTLLSSEVVLDGNVSDNDLLQARAYIEEKSFGELSVRLQLDIVDAQLAKSIEAELSQYPFVTIGTNPEIILVQEPQSTTLQLLTIDNYRLASIDTQVDATIWQTQVKEAIEAHIRNQFLRNLELTTPDYQLKTELRKRGANTTEVADIFAVDDIMEPVLTNTGKNGFYFCIIDIQPDNKMSVVYPATDTKEIKYNHSPGDFYLKPGATFPIDYLALRVGAPLGREVFKIICTPDPIDLRDVIRYRGQPDRGTHHAFENLVSELFFEREQQRSGSFLLGSDVGVVKSLVFDIVKKNP